LDLDDRSDPHARWRDFPIRTAKFERVSNIALFLIGRWRLNFSHNLRVLDFFSGCRLVACDEPVSKFTLPLDYPENDLPGRPASPY
jgi:hypothetical protein